MSRHSGMEAWIDHLAALASGLLAVPLTTLPARLWRRWPDLPMEAAALPSAVVTLLTGVVLGIRGFFEYPREHLALRVGDDEILAPDSALLLAIAPIRSASAALASSSAPWKTGS